MTAAADRHLLFGLLALQNGLIDQGALVAAFQAWTRDKATALADHLIARGELNVDDRAAIEALVTHQLKRHGGDVAKSLAGVPAGRSDASLADLGDPDIGATLGHVASGHGTSEDRDADCTASYAVGMATSDGQRFRVLRPHARGGLGAVFVALDAELHREVALKQILDQHADDPTSRARFLLEAEVTGGLEHPGIVPVYGLGAYADGRPYYAMRFIRGDSLKEAIGRFHADAATNADPGRRSLELRRLLRRFTDVCNAIEYAHSRGVLHRDIKPGNVIIGKHGEALVVDWGLAKPMNQPEIGAGAEERPLIPFSASGSADTLPGSALGTPAYMSPEQARGDLDRLGPRSDVYSLGATLYCLLSGKPPAEDADVGAVLRVVQKGDFPPPRQLNPKIDRALEAICQKAMALQPGDRYGSAKALADDVERWMADEPVSAWSEPISRRAARWARRHRPLVAGAAMLLMSALVGLSVGAVLINRERAKAEANFRQARAAVDEYFTTVSESKLLNVPGLQPLRKDLLDSAQKYYREFLRERGADPAVRAEAASASFRVGWIDQSIGRLAEALEPLRAATAAYEELARAHPGDAEFRRLTATGHGALGLLLSDLDRSDEAMAAHRRALAIREVLARDAPGDVLAQNDVARTHHNIGKIYRITSKPDDALAEWEKGGAIQRALLTRPLPRGVGRVDLTGRSDPSVIIRQDLAMLLLDRAGALRDAGRLDEAQATSQQSRELFEGLVREEPANLDLRAVLANAYTSQGSLLVDRGRLSESLPPFQRANEIIEQLAADNPSVPQYRSKLAESVLMLGWVFRMLGRTSEALASHARSIELSEGLVAANPSVAYYRSALAESVLKLGLLLRSLGRTSEALASFARSIELSEGLLAIQPDSAWLRNLLAQSLTQSGNLLLRAGRKTEALPQLRRAVEIEDAVVAAEPESVFYRSSLSDGLRGVGRAEAASGRLAEALAAFERASEVELTMADKYPRACYNLACSLALMVPVAPPDRRGALARRALDALRQAHAAGYANLASIRTDNDLDALRDRPDFRDFLLDMVFPADPFAARD